MYRDDGLVVFNSKKMKTQVHTWLNDFQLAVDELCGNSFLQFTTVMWQSDVTWLNDFQLAVDELCGNSFLQFTTVMWQSDVRPSRGNTGKLSVDTNQSFPYLDMEMYWNSRGQLLFRVHLKNNQQLLYLNCGSYHTLSCYRATVSGVLGWLAKLTSATAANLGCPMHQLYPERAKALQHAVAAVSRL
jgi:hypothetical protein